MRDRNIEYGLSVVREINGAGSQIIQITQILLLLGMVNLIEMLKMSSERLEQNLAMSGPTAQLHSGIAQAKEFEDPPGLLEKTEYLLREWVNAYHSRDAGKDSRQAFIVFVQLMNQHGILKTDDLITRFFRMSTQMCVDLCYR